MTPADAVRSLVREMLGTTGISRAPLHLRVRGFHNAGSRRPGFREATGGRGASAGHVDLKGGGASGSGINGGADAKSSRMLARQHASITPMDTPRQREIPALRM